MRMAEAADHPFSRVLASWAMGFLALRQGDLPQAYPVLERGLALAQKEHIRPAGPRDCHDLGGGLYAAGRTAEALPLRKQAINTGRREALYGRLCAPVVLQGEVYPSAGRLDQAGPKRSGHWHFARGASGVGPRSPRLRLRGQIGSTAGATRRLSRAETHYRQALALAEGAGHASRSRLRLPARSRHMATVEVWTSTAGPGRPGPVIELYGTPIEMTFWLPQAQGGAGASKTELEKRGEEARTRVNGASFRPHEQLHRARSER